MQLPDTGQAARGQGSQMLASREVLLFQQCTDHRSALARARKFIHYKILAQQATRYNRAGAGDRHRGAGVVN